MSIEYLSILIFLLLFTVFLEKRFRLHLYHNRRERLEITLLFFLVGVIWDSFAVWRGHWIFSLTKIAGLKIGFLPIEEYLFVLILPYFIITLYKLIDSKYRSHRSHSK